MKTKGFRKEFGVSVGQKIVKSIPTHGSCCCQNCGQDYNNCKCQENAVIEFCNYVDKLQAEKEELIKALQYCVFAQNNHSFSEVQCAANRGRMLLEIIRKGKAELNERDKI